MSNAHKFISESYQWGQVRGGRSTDAMTRFVCERCGKGFVHRYNIQPDIYKAAAESDFDFEICEPPNQQEGEG